MSGQQAQRILVQSFGEDVYAILGASILLKHLVNVCQTCFWNIGCLCTLTIKICVVQVCFVLPLCTLTVCFAMTVALCVYVYCYGVRTTLLVYPIRGSLLTGIDYTFLGVVRTRQDYTIDCTGQSTRGEVLILYGFTSPYCLKVWRIYTLRFWVQVQALVVVQSQQNMRKYYVEPR